MVAAALPEFVSVSEYLHSVYKPDVDYIDGVLADRSVGELDHYLVQRALLQALISGEQKYGYFVVQETRTQVSPTRFRVPDTCLMRREDLPERIIAKAPLLCIEVMSPEDRLGRLVTKCYDYLAMGVPEVWILDPQKRIAHVLHADRSLTEIHKGSLKLANVGVDLPLTIAFAGLQLR